MDSSSDKKSALDDLPKEELVKRYRNLLSIAQKAKQAKDVLQEENDALRKQLESSNTSSELIESLTNQKLEYVNQVEHLKKQISVVGNNLQKSLEETCMAEQRSNELEIDNIALKKQVKRLTDENEQLIQHLDSLSKEMETCKKLGMEQRSQLLEIEERNQDVTSVVPQDIEDLRNLLKVSIEEKDNLIERVEVYKLNLAEKDNNILTISEECQELKENISKLREKLKSYHSKIVKFAGTVKILKENKNEALTVLKTYTSQVEEWKGQLNSISQLIFTQFNELQRENMYLKENNAKFMTQLEHHKTDDEKSKEMDEAMKNTNKKLSEELKYCHKQLDFLTDENTRLASELSAILDKHREELKYFDDRNKKDAVEIRTRTEENEKICIEYRKIISKFEEDHEIQLKQIEQLKEQITSLENELEHMKSNEKQFADQTSSEILKLVQENSDLHQKIQQKRDTRDCEVQTETIRDKEEVLASLKRENSELLSEMNEMNQALKQRGETVSHLQAHCDEVMKKLQVYENQASKNYDNITEKEDEIRSLSAQNEEKEITINQLRSELESLKEKLDCSFAESETLSTSTISRNEEIARMKDLEGPWEERYGKLRNLALKMKGKIRELTTELASTQNEKNDLQLKLSNTLDNLSTIQAQSDTLQKELQENKNATKISVEKTEKLFAELETEKGKVTPNLDQIDRLKSEIQALMEEKTKTEIWKKNVSTKVQALRKEVEANRVLKKEFESQIAKLTSDLESKDKALKKEMESHQQTRNSLDNSNSERKKNSLLNLEMQDYERTVNDLSRKLEKKQDIVEKLKNQNESNKSTIDALREQNKLLEDRLREIDGDLEQAKIEIAAYKKQVSDLEGIATHKEATIGDFARSLETARSENEELSTELSKIVAEHQKVANVLKSEKDSLRSEVLALQQKLRESQNNLKLKLEELKTVRSDYENYKVRAQSVLRQSQNRDVGLEERLSEQVTNLNDKCKNLEVALEETKANAEKFKQENENFRKENGSLSSNLKDIKEELEDLKVRYDQLSEKYQQMIVENAETVRSLKVHSETLAQCYRQQISEQEVRHNREILELQNKIDKAPSPVDVPLSLIQSMPREEGEGSESTEHFNRSTQLLPLERLLSADVDQDTVTMRKQLLEEETKVGHLTALLADTEQDLAKHVQMNKVLKEEIRRQQRSVEREKHAENLEYLKNIVFKFVTLHSGDERSRLVPVLNTILKLSPDEMKKLTDVAKGDLKAWSNYLPSWPSTSK